MSHAQKIAPPSDWVMRFLPGVTPGGAVLDVACGSGRHLRAARAQGHPVVGIDRDTSAVTDLAGQAGVEIIAADLEAGQAFPLENRQFAGVIVTNYLWRPILPAIAGAVAPDGLLIYETFAAGHEALGGRPSNPDFLLQPNELLGVALDGGLTVIAFEQVTLAKPRARIVQRIAAAGTAHPWVRSPPGCAV